MVALNKKELYNQCMQDPAAVLRNDDDLWLKFARNFIYILTTRNEWIPFVPKPEQLRFLGYYWQANQEDRPFLSITLKSRQIGWTTMLSCIIATSMLLKNDLEVIISGEQKDASGANAFEMHKGIYNHYLPYSHLTERNRFITIDNNGVKFTNLNNCRLRVIGEREEIGRTVDIAHITECAHFTDFEKMLRYMLQGIHDVSGKMIALESTAKDSNDGFKRTWDAAVAGESEFIPFFSPWYENPEYTAEIPAAEYDDFIASLGQDQTKYGDEKALQAQYNLMLEQLYFRRKRIATRCQGLKEVFDQLYPCTPEDAFRAFSEDYFHPQSIDWQKSHCVSDEYEDGHIVIDVDVETHAPVASDIIDLPNWDVPYIFEPLQSGAIRVFEEPDPHSTYCWGSDHADGGPDGDFNVAVFCKREPFQVVATIRGEDHTKLRIEEFARQLAYMIKWYNEARGVPESNPPAGLVIEILKLCGLGKCMLLENAVFPKKQTETISNSIEYGVRTTTATKRAGGEFLKEALRVDFTVDPPVARSEYALRITDERILREMEYVNPHKGSFQAVNKGEHRRKGESSLGYLDDMVIATMMAVLAHRALPAPITRDEALIKKYGHFHPLTAHIQHILPDDPFDESNPATQEEAEWRQEAF